MSKSDKMNDGEMDPPYDVGYGRPPAASRFKPGQSGNPRGRKKGTKNAAQIVKAVLNETITVIEGGSPKKYTRWEAILRITTSRSLKGDPKALAALLPILKAVGMIEPEREELSAQDAQAMSDADQQVVAEMLARFS